MHLLLFLLIGLLAGWIAAKLMRGEGFGLWGNLALGVIGAFIGGLIFGWLDIRAVGLVGELVAAVIGAIVLLWIVRLFRKSTAK